MQDVNPHHGGWPRGSIPFLFLLPAFILRHLLSWPILFSLDAWVFKDRGSFLNLDYMLADHLRLGVDTYYSYGLLPVLIQHNLFVAFGRGYWPMVGCTALSVVLMAAFWGRFISHLPNQTMWLVGVIAICPTLLPINPILPYSLVQLSMLFALLAVLEKRLDIALAVSVVGCLSVPSMPLVLFLLLVVAIVAEWWLGSDHSIRRLFRQLAPGISTYVLISAILLGTYGVKSLWTTMLPVLGLQFYEKMGYGGLGNLLGFLYPAGEKLRFYLEYYCGAPVTWWATSTVALFIFAGFSAQSMIHRPTLERRSLFVALCAILQAAFTFLAFGSHGQHGFYDPILAAGTILGISLIQRDSYRKPVFAGFVVLCVLGQSSQIQKVWSAWRETKPSVSIPSLYVDPKWMAEWSKVLEISDKRNVFLLSYGTGIHHYFPTVHNADAWFLQTGQLFPSDKERLLSGLREAEVIVEDRTGPTAFIDQDKDIQSLFTSMCLGDSTSNFRTWWKPNMSPGSSGCALH